MRGRPTLDKKDQTIKLRLNDEMREWIESESSRQGISMSECIRCLIEAEMAESENFPKKQKGSRPRGHI